MILITGANGQLGKGVVKNLLGLVPADQIAISVRNPVNASEFSEKGIHVRSGDFSKPSELSKSFAGAKQVLVISVDKVGEAAVRMHCNAIEAAREADATHVYYTSHQGARADSSFAPAADHFVTESFLSKGGAFTSFRHGFYTESALHMIGHGLPSGEIRAPEDGPISWTSRGDLAEADARIIADESRLHGLVTLTASEMLTMSNLAEIASEVLGRKIKRVTLKDEEWVQEKAAQGVPKPMAEMLLGTFKAARRGDFAVVDPTLEAILGRKPQSMSDVLRRSQLSKIINHR